MCIHLLLFICVNQIFKHLTYACVSRYSHHIDVLIYFVTYLFNITETALISYWESPWLFFSLIILCMLIVLYIDLVKINESESVNVSLSV